MLGRAHICVGARSLIHAAHTTHTLFPIVGLRAGQESVLSRCKNQQLAAVLQRLRDLFFPDSSETQPRVSADMFIEAVRQTA